MPVTFTEDLLASVASLEINNIGKTVDSVDRNDFADVADALFAADRVHTFGMGVSALLAELAAYTLLQVGVSATCLSTAFSSPRE